MVHRSGFDQEVPHHSTFSKNRHGRFQESTVFEQLFEEVVAQCLAVGLVRGDKLSVDGTFVEANASKVGPIFTGTVGPSFVDRSSRSIERCTSTLPSLKYRTRWRNRRIARTRCPPPIRTPPMRLKAGRRHAWVITTTT